MTFVFYSGKIKKLRSKSAVNCVACNKKFLKFTHHIKENLKLGQRFYCSISGKKIFIEYFGLANDLESYDKTINKKKTLCQKHGIKLIDLYAKDLFPVINLDAKIPKL